MNEIVINAEGHILGRLASYVAKKAIEKNKIVVVNAEKALMIGNKNVIIEKFKQRRSFRMKGNPMKGPKYPRMPDRILRRAIRGMLPYKKAKGREAYHRVKVYIGVPERYVKVKQEKIVDAVYDGTRRSYTLEEISRILGARW